MARLKGVLWLVVGLLVAITAGFVAYLVLANAATQATIQTAGAQVDVVVAARTIHVGRILSQEDLTLEKMPVKLVPDGALQHIGDAVDKMALTDMYEGEVVLSQRIAVPDVVSGNGRVAAIMAEEHVLMALPAADLMSHISLLKPGDHVDILYTLDVPASASGNSLETLLNTQPVMASSATNTKKATFIALENVVIAALVDPENPITSENGANQNDQTLGTNNATSENPNAILIAVLPQDALMLKYLQDAGGVFDLVLRSPANDQPADADPVDINYIKNRYQLSSP